MLARWGPQRRLRLDELPEPVRAAIFSMLDAEKAAKAREQDGG
jgi:hypothetical protein